MVELRLLSSLAKVYVDRPLNLEHELTNDVMLKNDRYHFQVAFRTTSEKCAVSYECKHELGDAVSVRYVNYVPCDYTVPPHIYHLCEHKEPGILPDILQPVPREPWAFRDSWRAFWVTVDGSKAPLSPGKYPITLTVKDTEEASATFEIEVLDASLPEQTLPVTNWLHCDSICHYHNVEFASEEFWRLVPTYIESALRNNSNMILTPLFTPPLDTLIGGERLTTQLVDVTVTNGEYTFGFSKLECWLDMCVSLGVRYIEMSHLFTQWGCKYAPKVMATVDGEYKRIFGWETDGHGEEYLGFLGELLPKLTEFLKSKNVYDNCFFHISDEPELDMIEDYRKCSDFIKKHIPLEKVIDALSCTEYCKQGLIINPVVLTNHYTEFTDLGIDTAWCYYCCGPLDAPNRCIPYPSHRMRMLGFMMFRHNAKGFLHWGLNFYNTWHSCEPIDPYSSSTANGWAPSGDPYILYPSKNGGDIESIRLCVFSDSIKDYLALCELEKVMPREEILKKFGLENIQFNTFFSANQILKLRSEIYKLLAKIKNKVIK